MFTLVVAYTLPHAREDCFRGTFTSQVLSGEKQQCLQEEVAAVEASREVLRQDNKLLEEKVRVSQTKGYYLIGLSLYYYSCQQTRRLSSPSRKTWKQQE